MPTAQPEERRDRSGACFTRAPMWGPGEVTSPFSILSFSYSRPFFCYRLPPRHSQGSRAPSVPSLLARRNSYLPPLPPLQPTSSLPSTFSFCSLWFSRTCSLARGDAVWLQSPLNSVYVWDGSSNANEPELYEAEILVGVRPKTNSLVASSTAVTVEPVGASGPISLLSLWRCLPSLCELKDLVCIFFILH